MSSSISPMESSSIGGFSALNLHTNIQKAIAICGYQTPTPIQSKAIPVILNRNDVIASAQTGTGKTAAFVLPALHHLCEQKNSQEKANRKPRILILTPTRELARQITHASSLYGKFLKFNIVSLVGGMSYHHQIRDLSRGADIIVATPGRLLDHLERKRVDLSHIDMLILDEADRMLDMGFIDDVKTIANFTPSTRQTLLISATLDNQLINAIKHLLKNPIRIDIAKEKTKAPVQIKQELYKADNAQHKTRLLKHFLNDETIYKAIIFSATKANADRIAYQLQGDGFAAAPLHGDLKQNVRNRTIEQLRNGKIQFLVATDVAARGIDISDITHVINYDLPKFCEDYVHRIGRTGRAGKTGKAISFVLPTDNRHLQRIERYIGQRLQITKENGIATESDTFSIKKFKENNSSSAKNNSKNNSKNNGVDKEKNNHFRSEKTHKRKNQNFRFSKNDKRRNSSEKYAFYAAKTNDSHISASRRKNKEEKPAQFRKKRNASKMTLDARSREQVGGQR